MPARLYFDAARQGLTLRCARRALEDFLRLTAEGGCSQEVEQLFYQGYPNWPLTTRGRYSGLESWQGLSFLKTSLCKLAQAPPGSRLLLAQRSAQLMRLAAKLLTRQCRRILVTDLSWPGYAAILQRELTENSEIVCAKLRSDIFDAGISAAQVIQRIATAFQSQHCDGLFLPAVSNEGIRLPIPRICQALGHPRRPRFVVIDGAQAMCHTGCQPDMRHADLYLSGCHKWMGAGSFPLGLGFCPRRRTRGHIRETVERMLATAELDDPLLRFIAEIETGRISRFSETLSLACLFGAEAAVSQWRSEKSRLPQYHGWQLRTADQIAKMAAEHGWIARRPDASLRSGILLLQTEDSRLRKLPADAVREMFQRQGVAVTAYGDGLIRLAMPQVLLRQFEIEDLADALEACSTQELGLIAIGTPIA